MYEKQGYPPKRHFSVMKKKGDGRKRRNVSKLPNANERRSDLGITTWT